MPVQVSYPGVYIQEIPSGVHTVTGVATSVTAFVGRTQRGPVNKPIGISNFGDYQRMFGGLDVNSSVSYAIRDFFQNGGGQAVVVRLVAASPAPGTTGGASRAAIQLPGLALSDLALSGALSVAKAAVGAGLPAGAKLQDVQSAAKSEAALSAGDPAKTSAAQVAKATGASLAPPAPVKALAAGTDTEAGATADTGANEGEANESEGTAPAAQAGAPTDAKSAVDAALAGVGPAVDRGMEQVNQPADVTVLTGIGTMLKDLFDYAVGTENVTAAQVATEVGTLAADAKYKLPAGVQTTLTQAASAAAAVSTPPATVQSVLDATIDAVHDALRGDLTGAAPSPVQIRLEASSEGVWGRSLTASIDRDGITPAVATAFGFADPMDLFNLTVTLNGADGKPVAAERYLNISLTNNVPALNIQGVLAHQSNLVSFPDQQATTPDSTPKGKPVQATGGADSPPLSVSDYVDPSLQGTKGGIYALDKWDLFNLLCIPPDLRVGAPPTADGTPAGDTNKQVYQDAAEYCAERRAMLIVDPPNEWVNLYNQGTLDQIDPGTFYGFTPEQGRASMVYFPRVRIADPLKGGQIAIFPACGAIAGITARTDVNRGVWKAPAGIDAVVGGIDSLEVKLTDHDSGVLNPKGINALRTFPVIGNVVWGSRTLRGADQLADDYKYVPVRRLTDYIEESLYRGTQWAVFEPNDEPLWSQLRLNIGAFMADLFRQGAFQGSSPKDAYFVKCDSTTTTQNDINQGIVNVQIGFAPLKPAEFVVLSIQQIAGQITT